MQLPGARGLLCVALVAVSLCASAEARAELDLRWQAPAGCPDREQVLEKIRAIAGAALDESEGLAVEATITRQARRARLELIVLDAGRTERRVITSDSCMALAGATAVTLALLLGVGEAPSEQRDDQQAPSAPNASENSEGASATSAGARGTESELRAEGSRSESSDEPGRDQATRASASAGPGTKRSWAFVVRAPFVAADLGPLPRPALGVGLGLGLRFGAWGLSLSGHVSRNQTVDGTLPLVESSGTELDRTTGQLALCRGWRGPHFELSPCLGLALEVVSVRGIGEGVSPRARRAVWPAPGLSAVAHWHILESFAFFATVGGYLELSRPRFLIQVNQELGEVERLAPASLGAAFGVEWIL